jgi:hypothetical protein
VSSSIEQFFNETQAVATILSDWVKGVPETEFHGAESDSWVAEQEEFFTAVWQAVELLSRAATYIHAQMQAELSRGALLLPDPEPEQKKQPKAARLYDGQGRPIA